MRRVGSVRLTGARRLRLPSPVPGGEVGCPWQRHRLLHSRSWSGGACGTRPDRVSCRLASLCQVVTIATAARARACHALLILPSSPPETLGCEDIRFVVVLGSDPCDLHRGEKGWRVRRLFSHREGSQRRTGGVQHATTRAISKKVRKTIPPYGVQWGGVGGGGLNNNESSVATIPLGRKRRTTPGTCKGGLSEQEHI